MEWVTIFFVMLAVLLVGGSLAALGVRGPGRNLVWFFIVLFLGTWAIGIWAEPVGPRVWGVPWVSYFVAAVFIGLLIAAVGTHARTPPETRRRIEEESSLTRDMESEIDAEGEDREGLEEAAAVATVLNLFMWAFLIVALAVLAVRVFFDPTV